MIKSIYCIGSLRNANVPDHANRLREAGFEVFDDWYGAGHEADDMWQRYEDKRGRNYRDALAGHAAQHVFNFDRTHIERCDAVLLVLPAGKSGHLEFGFARGRDKFGVIMLDGEPERFDVMYNFASYIALNVEEAIAAFKESPSRQSGVTQTFAPTAIERVRDALAQYDRNVERSTAPVSQRPD